MSGRTSADDFHVNSDARAGLPEKMLTMAAWLELLAVMRPEMDEVSLFYSPLTFRANPAHNLTRAPVTYFVSGVRAPAFLLCVSPRD